MYISRTAVHFLANNMIKTHQETARRSGRHAAFLSVGRYMGMLTAIVHRARLPDLSRWHVVPLLLASLLLGANAPLCDPPWLPLNGSAFLQYNSTSYNDDMAWASTWMYLCVLTFLITNLFLGL